jgi:hypothetical protein
MYFMFGDDAGDDAWRGRAVRGRHTFCVDVCNRGYFGSCGEAGWADTGGEGLEVACMMGKE